MWPAEHRPLGPDPALVVPEGSVPGAAGFRPLDVLDLGYFGLVFALIALRHDLVRDPVPLVVQFGLCALAVPTLARLATARPDAIWIRVLRPAFPLLVLLATYEAIGHYVLVLRGHFVDAAVNAAEHRVFGIHPNVLLERWSSPALTEALMCCYICFYTYFLVPPVLLVVRRQFRRLEEYVFALVLPSYLCYVGFLFVPVLGPTVSLRGEFGDPRPPGYTVTSLVSQLMAHGDPVGTNFPSSHIAAAWSCLVALRGLISRRAFWTIIPINGGLTLATVYGRFHYVSDALAGLVVAAASILIARTLRLRSARTQSVTAP